MGGWIWTKGAIVLVAVLPTPAPTPSPAPRPAQIILIRHAEKPADPKDPVRRDTRRPPRS